MSETLKALPSTKAIQRFVRWLLVALIVSSVGGIVSVATNVTSYHSHTDSTGTTTEITHHTLASRIVLTAVIVFHAFMIVGILCRAPIAWRAGFSLPVFWVLLVAVASWSQLHSPGSSLVADIIIPYAILAAIGGWQIFVWRKRWAFCEEYFK